MFLSKGSIINFMYRWGRIKINSEPWVEFKEIMVKYPPGSYPKTNHESTMKNYKHSKNLLEKEYYDK